MTKVNYLGPGRYHKGNLPSGGQKGQWAIFLSNHCIKTDIEDQVLVLNSDNFAEYFFFTFLFK